MAEREGIPFLGALPIDTELVELLDGEAIAEKEKEKDVVTGAAGSGVEADSLVQALEEHTFALMERYQKTPTYKLFSGMSDKILARLEELSAE